MSVSLADTAARPAPGELYRMSLESYAASLLRGVCDHLELRTTSKSPARLAKLIEDHLRSADQRMAAVVDMPNEFTVALRLLPVVPSVGWSLIELRDLVRYQGVREPERAIRTMLALGLLALHAPPTAALPPGGVRNFEEALDGWCEESGLMLVPHPALALDNGSSPFTAPRRGRLRRVNAPQENDGRELLTRVAVLWQRVAESPVRLTQYATLFKRDEERLFADGILASPLFDEAAAVADIGRVAVVLGQELGLLVPDPESELLGAEFAAAWQEDWPAIQRRMCVALVGTRSWHEAGGGDDSISDLRHLPAARRAALFTLAALDPADWIRLDELARELAARNHDRSFGMPTREARPLRVVIGESVNGRSAVTTRSEAEQWLESFLLGPMYQLGVAAAAHDPSDNARVVRLTELGRWIVGVGPQPAAPAEFEKALYVQPNHEVIAYRQGLTPELLGQLASFCQFKGLGAALTFELTAVSIYRGLELGRTVDEMIAILDRHSQRPLPPTVVDSMRTWSGRRERLRLYSECTILEFASTEELDDAVARGLAGERLTDRLLLMDSDRSIPFDQVKLAGSRDYRQPPTLCVEAAPDGITWQVELGKADLLVERELSRFAERLSVPPIAADHSDADHSNGDLNGARLHYRITPESLAAAARAGLRPSYLRDWFQRRAAGELPSSVELILQGLSRNGVRFANLLVVQVASKAVADGIAQHPLTAPHVADRLGDVTLAVRPDHADALLAALRELGVTPAEPATGTLIDVDLH